MRSVQEVGPVGGLAGLPEVVTRLVAMNFDPRPTARCLAHPSSVRRFRSVYLRRSHVIEKLPVIMSWSYKDYKVMLLPSGMSKVYVHRQYVKAYDSENQGGDAVISRRTFESLWSQLCPYITVMKPATDVCFECQENTSLLMKAANMPESMKSKLISHAQKHFISSNAKAALQ